MKVRVFGCRGSLASPGPATVRYGGNTSCVEVRAGDTVIVLDAGSGMRPLGVELAAAGVSTVHVFLTHLHLDHLQGLAFFDLFWRAGVELHIWGPASPLQSLAERVAAYVSPPLFPVHLSDVPSRPVFHDVPDEPFAVGEVTVLGLPVVHSGPTLGYRLEHGGRSLAYIPDHEPSLGVELRHLEPEWISGHPVAARADVLLHDAQYGLDEYEAHVGWGHSSIDHTVALAEAAEVAQLVLFHHDPSHSDDHLEDLCDWATAAWTASADPPLLAFEGMAIDLDGATTTIGRDDTVTVQA